jgi:hypothetical protein
MKDRLRKFLNSVILILGVLLIVSAAGIELYGRAFSFSGQICIPTGKSERTVVRGAENSPHGLTADQVSFDNPETAKVLRIEDKKYLARRLPAPLRLDGINVISRSDPEDVLIDKSGRETRVTPGAQVAIDGRNYLVREVRKWSGLLEDSGGRPFVSVAASSDGTQWKESINLADDEWREFAPALAVHFKWADSKEAAMQCTKTLPGIEAARWGVVDGGAIDWFDSFLPGTGATLKSGASVTLLEVDEAKPALLVEIKQNNQTRQAHISPQDTSEPVRFEFPARADCVVLISAWRSHVAHAAAFSHGKLTGEMDLEPGADWQPAGFSSKIRLDQVLEQCVPITEDHSMYNEIVLRAADDESHLLIIREDDKREERYPKFVRRETQPVVKYAFTLNESGKGRKFNLGPDDSFSAGPWKLEQAQKGLDPVHMALLDAEWRPFRGYVRYPLACALALLVLLLLKRF